MSTLRGMYIIGKVILSLSTGLPDSILIPNVVWCLMYESRKPLFQVLRSEFSFGIKYRGLFIWDYFKTNFSSE